MIDRLPSDNLFIVLLSLVALLVSTLSVVKLSDAIVIFGLGILLWFFLYLIAFGVLYIICDVRVVIRNHELVRERLRLRTTLALGVTRLLLVDLRDVAGTTVDVVHEVREGSAGLVATAGHGLDVVAGVSLGALALSTLTASLGTPTTLLATGTRRLNLIGARRDRFLYRGPGGNRTGGLDGCLQGSRGPVLAVRLLVSVDLQLYYHLVVRTRARRGLDSSGFSRGGPRGRSLGVDGLSGGSLELIRIEKKRVVTPSI